MNWFTSDNAEYGSYVITIKATGLDNVTAEISWTLTMKRQCLDANFILKLTAWPSFIPYILEDPTYEKTLRETSVVSDQTFVQCPHPVVYDLTFSNGTALSDDVFSWDPTANQLSIFTDDYDRFVNDTLHELLLVAHYETFPRDSGD